MKKIVLFSLITLLLIPAGVADNGPFRFGLKASPSIAWLRPETRGYESEGIRIGLSYGIAGEYSLGEFYALAGGLQISSFGGSLSFQHVVMVDEQQQEGFLERVYRLRYLEIPVTLKMHTQEIGYFTYYGKFGFSPGMNLRARGDDTFRYGENTLTEDDVDIKSEVTFFRLALVIGLGAEYSLGGRTALVGGLTFNNGFTNVLAGRNQATDVKHSAVSNYLELTIGVMF